DRVESEYFALDEFDFKGVSIGVKQGQVKQKLSIYLIKKFFLNIRDELQLFKDDTWGRVFERRNPENVTEINGIKCYCDIREDGVYIYPITRDIEEMRIPPEVTLAGQTYKVAGIGDHAFRGNNSIKRITFEEGIKKLNIGKYTFYECWNLTDFTVPPGVEELNIGGSGFCKCKRLTSFNVPKSVKILNIGESAFGGFGNIFRNFIMEEGIETLNIGGNAFGGCENMENFHIPNSVLNLSIAEAAFSYCTLSDFIIPDRVTRLSFLRIHQYHLPMFGYRNPVHFTVTVPDSVQELTIDADIGTKIELPPEGHIEKEKIADGLRLTSIIRRAPQEVPEAAVPQGEADTTVEDADRESEELKPDSVIAPTTEISEPVGESSQAPLWSKAWSIIKLPFMWLSNWFKRWLGN
ncbi:MAG: leucine-rich repeat domain-containing protein, partial [Clostridia bacterium]|nr:leucine-rich repeat domain-containing protein [Clostridia bacterium]